LRDYTSVLAIAEKLLNMSGRANTMGQEFLGRVLSRQSTTREQADALFRNLTGCPDPITRAGAYMHLTSREVLVYQNLDEAIYFANKALPLALNHSPIITAQIQDLLSIALSIKGDHKRSLTLCQENLKLTKLLSKYDPFLYFNALNSLAVVLFEDKQTEYAAHLIKQVAQSPYYSKYPEWQESFKDIMASQSSPQIPKLFKGFDKKEFESKEFEEEKKNQPEAVADILEDEQSNISLIPENKPEVVGEQPDKNAQIKNLFNIEHYIGKVEIRELQPFTLTGAVRPFRPKSPFVRRLNYTLFLDFVLIDIDGGEVVAHSMVMDHYPVERYIEFYDRLEQISTNGIVGVGIVRLEMRLVSEQGVIVEVLREDDIFESSLHYLFELIEEMDNWLVQPFFDEGLENYSALENHWNDLALSKKVLKKLNEN
jgi:hypothetical protein